jgi:hypothetical protein
MVATLAIAAVSLPCGGRIRAEDDTVVDAAARRAHEQSQQVQQVVLDQQMKGMFFNPTGDEAKAVQQCLRRLLLEVAALGEVCGLSERQRLKCEMAARLDVARAMDEIEAVRRKYAGRTINLQEPAGQQEWQRFLQEAQTVQTKLQEAGRDAGMLNKVIRGILDDGQQQVWLRETELRKRYQWQAVVEAGMGQLDLVLGLTSAQHEAMSALLMEKPLRINHAKLSLHGNHFAPYVCKYGLSLVDWAKLQALLSERQQKTLRESIGQGKGMAMHLKQQQMLFE